MAVGLAGYIHTWRSSRLAIGGEARTEVEQGWERHTGSWGTFRLHRVSGYSAGDQDPGSPVLARPPLGPTPRHHDDFVRRYFVHAGLPLAQVGTVRPWPPAASPPSPFEKVHRSSLVARAFRGIPIVESFAWASVCHDGAVASEGVYWPPVGGDVVDEALALWDLFANARSFGPLRKRLPKGRVRIAIHHSACEPVVASRSIEVRAVFDVTEARFPGRGGARHFDREGVEVWLPQERAASRV